MSSGCLATAKSLLAWHARHGFCANCGSATRRPADAGWRRVCPACGTQHFPRTDPVVIMLIPRAIPACSAVPRWPAGMYSCLAGFMEPGEFIEAAVRRETFEEAGLRVGAAPT